MSRYRSVDTKLHGDPRYRELSGSPVANAQEMLMLLLTTGDDRCIPGLVVAGLGYFIEHRPAWKLRDVKECAAELEASGLVRADWTARVAWIPSAFEVPANQPRTNKNLIGWRTHWSEVPECALKLEVWREVRNVIEQRGAQYLEAFDEVCPMPVLERPRVLVASQAVHHLRLAVRAETSSEMPSQTRSKIGSQVDPRSAHRADVPIPDPRSSPKHPSALVPVPVPAQVLAASAPRRTRSRDPVVRAPQLRAAAMRAAAHPEAPPELAGVLEGLALLRERFSRERVLESELVDYSRVLSTGHEEHDVRAAVQLALARCVAFPSLAEIEGLAREARRRREDSEPRPVPEREEDPRWWAVWCASREEGVPFAELAGEVQRRLAAQEAAA